ncbi:MAG: metallophosphoesterase family protein [Clostridia bacterium]|nr:metallophosphoesterase family protein [Clostridia bacterium]
MDKIAIISDVHGCYVSLKAIFDDIEKRGIQHIFMLGDLVAKGSEPDKTIDLIREKCEVVIKGNCDDIVSENAVTKEHFWNKNKIGKKREEYLKSLPKFYDFYMSGLKIRLMHASPKTTYKSINIYDITEALNKEIVDMFEDEENIDVIIFGHIHSPFIYRLDNKMLVNTGSVSNSCDLITKNEETNLLASYLILEGEYNSNDAANISYELVKVPFDYQKEIKNLENSDMPNKDMAIAELKTGIYVAR